MCVLHIMGNIQLRLSFDLAISLPEICAKELYEQMCKKKKKLVQGYALLQKTGNNLNVL